MLPIQSTSTSLCLTHLADILLQVIVAYSVIGSSKLSNVYAVFAQAPRGKYATSEGFLECSAIIWLSSLSLLLVLLGSLGFCQVKLLSSQKRVWASSILLTQGQCHGLRPTYLPVASSASDRAERLRVATPE